MLSGLLLGGSRVSRIRVPTWRARVRCLCFQGFRGPMNRSVARLIAGAKTCHLGVTKAAIGHYHSTHPGTGWLSQSHTSTTPHWWLDVGVGHLMHPAASVTDRHLGIHGSGLRSGCLRSACPFGRGGYHDRRVGHRARYPSLRRELSLGLR